VGCCGCGSVAVPDRQLGFVGARGGRIFNCHIALHPSARITGLVYRASPNADAFSVGGALLLGRGVHERIIMLHASQVITPHSQASLHASAPRPVRDMLQLYAVPPCCVRPSKGQDVQRGSLDSKTIRLRILISVTRQRSMPSRYAIFRRSMARRSIVGLGRKAHAADAFTCVSLCNRPVETLKHLSGLLAGESDRSAFPSFPSRIFDSTATLGRCRRGRVQQPLQV